MGKHSERLSTTEIYTITISPTEQFIMLSKIAGKLKDPEDKQKCDRQPQLIEKTAVKCKKLRG